MLEQCCNNSKQCRNNVATLCCAQNRRCESSRVTSIKCRFVLVTRVVSQSTPLIRRGTMPATGMIAVARIEVYIYRIFSSKRPGAYLKFRVKGGALIERTELNRGVCVYVGGGGVSNFLLEGMLLHFG